ncbi:TetR/AcrR family transcriptional regulator [Phreatobacter sp.]|uniref:TetR/AcrR family transcriptional regulator n=1 Tax=Phreatobacter sp. TaxID=1966341 RepID=UPI003F6F9860
MTDTDDDSGRPVRRPPGRKPSAEKRAAIVAAALRLFAERGVEGATTREIAAGAGTTERTLFKHFGGKDGLVRAVVEDASLALVRQASFARVLSAEPFTPDTFAGWHRQFLEERVAAADRSPDTYRVIVRELLRDDGFRQRYSAAWMSAVFGPLERQLASMQERGLIATGSSPQALAGLFFSLNLGYLASRYVLAPERGWETGGDIGAIVALFRAACGRA